MVRCVTFTDSAPVLQTYQKKVYARLRDSAPRLPLAWPWGDFRQHSMYLFDMSVKRFTPSHNHASQQYMYVATIILVFLGQRAYQPWQ